MAEKFTRGEEKHLPDFKSAEEAFSYFRERYGKDFSFQGTQLVGGVECWFCNLILDRETYRKGMRELRQGNPVMGLEFALSYQPFELYASGHVHVIY